VLDIAKHNELQNLQWKVEYLRNEVNMLEWEKTKATNHILKLNRRIDEFEGTLAKKRGEVNQESGTYDNIENLYPVAYQEPTILYSTILLTDE
jgi:chromosome segregation ATPase